MILPRRHAIALAAGRPVRLTNCSLVYRMTSSRRTARLTIVNSTEKEAAVIPRIQTIVVPTDFSPASDRAVDYAAALASPFGATLHLLHVVEEPFLAGGGWEWYIPSARAVREKLTSDSLARLSKIADRLIERGLSVTTGVAYGAPAEGIVTSAGECLADLIVMSTHGRSGVPHLVLGSVAERVIRSAHCPVLAVRETREVKTTRAVGEATVCA